VGALEELIEKLGVMPPAARRRLVDQAKRATKGLTWVPNPGFQTDAYLSEADEIGCGGEAGPGKTSYLVGLALNVHQRSLLLRRKNSDVAGLVDEFEKSMKYRPEFDKYGSFKYGARRIRIGGCQHEHDKQKYKGDPRDLIAFDQVEDFLESQYVFIIGWNRPATKGQRCRVVASLNPPTMGTGLWVFRRWAPWLDPRHPNPAKSGELRWFTTILGEDTEVDGPGPHLVEGKKVMAKSRTFIRGRLEENPDLAGSGYEGRLAGMPSGLREAYLEGKFEASLRDQPDQVIPTAWVQLAQKRWNSLPPAGVPMCAIGVDCSGGGQDPMILAPRYDGWYPPLIEVPGKEIPTERIGSYCAGVIIGYRKDKAMLVIDLGGGYGSSTYEHCKENGIDAFGYKGAERTERRATDKRLRFTNVRSAAHWTFREALDPDQPGGSPIMLPFDPELVADLTSPTFKVTPNGIQVEPKEEVVKRLGRSTDKGDAVIMAWWAGPKMINSALEWATIAEEQGNRARGPGKVIIGRDAARAARENRSR